MTRDYIVLECPSCGEVREYDITDPSVEYYHCGDRLTGNDRAECMDERPDDPCHGPVGLHSVDPGRAKAWPRCDKHWRQRLDRRRNSIEMYENSDVAPSWFDPALAGERWDDDY